MENITFTLADMHLHGSAFYDFLRLRKRFFVDNLGWKIPHDDDVEMDQYDNPKATYSVVLRDGEVIGGARVLPTTATWGTHTYMLRDAVQGKLIDIPPSVLGKDIVQEDLLECTRLVMCDSVRTHAERNACLTLIAKGLEDIVAQHNARSLICLSTLSMLRAVRQIGYKADRVGEPYINETDGRKYAVLSMSPGPREHIVPKATHRPSPTPVHAPATA